MSREFTLHMCCPPPTAALLGGDIIQRECARAKA
jgi:hypothetical protein